MRRSSVGGIMLAAGREEMVDRVTDAETADSRRNWLYKIGGAAAPFSVAVIPIQLVVCIIWPPPDTAIGWFTLLQSNNTSGNH
jgi:hypothetical protein